MNDGKEMGEVPIQPFLVLVERDVVCLYLNSTRHGMTPSVFGFGMAVSINDRFPISEKKREAKILGVLELLAHISLECKQGLL